MATTLSPGVQAQAQAGGRGIILGTHAEVHRLRQVLVIAYHFPPCDNPAGSARSEAFVRQLPGYGWQPHVLCAATDARMAERHGMVTRIRSWTPWAKPFNVAPFGWGPPMLRAARRHLADRPFDAVYASFPPTGHATSVTRLARSCGLPLVVDMRDAWTLNPYRKDDPANRFLARRAPAQEAALFSAARRVLFNTPSALSAYRQRYPAMSGRFECLPNGYDEDLFPRDGLAVGEPADADGGELVIGYLGALGVSGRDATEVLQALAMLRARQVPVRLRLIGDDSAETLKAIERHGLSDAVERRPRLPAAEALAELARCDEALLYQAPSHAAVSAVAGKTHEYLRLGKPILAVAPPGDNLDLLRQAAGDLEAVEQPAPAEAVAQAIHRLAARKAGGQLPRFRPAGGEYLAAYSRRALSGRLAAVLDEVVHAARTSGDGW